MTTGLNSDGQLGTGNTSNRTSFGAVSGLTDVDEVAGGREHVRRARRRPGVRMGRRLQGRDRTGQYRGQDRLRAVVTGLSGVTNVSTGHYHSLALLADGTVRAWGFNSMGQLGDNTTAQAAPAP